MLSSFSGWTCSAKYWLTRRTFMCHNPNNHNLKNPSFHGTRMFVAMPQQPSTWLYTEPNEPSPHHPTLFFKLSFNIIFTLSLCPPSGLYLSIIPKTFYMCAMGSQLHCERWNKRFDLIRMAVCNWCYCVLSIFLQRITSLSRMEVEIVIRKVPPVAQSV